MGYLVFFIISINAFIPPRSEELKDSNSSIKIILSPPNNDG